MLDCSKNCFLRVGMIRVAAMTSSTGLGSFSTSHLAKKASDGIVPATSWCLSIWAGCCCRELFSTANSIRSMPHRLSGSSRYSSAESGNCSSSEKPENSLIYFKIFLKSAWWIQTVLQSRSRSRWSQII